MIHFNMKNDFHAVSFTAHYNVCTYPTMWILNISLWNAILPHDDILLHRMMWLEPICRIMQGVHVSWCDQFTSHAELCTRPTPVRGGERTSHTDLQGSIIMKYVHVTWWNVCLIMRSTTFLHATMPCHIVRCDSAHNEILTFHDDMYAPHMRLFSLW
jgi:hypothetical protein